MMRWSLLIFCLVFTAIGAIGGWMAARQSQPIAPSEAPDPHDSDPEHDHEEKSFSPEALANLGVTVAKLRASSFTRTREIAAHVERTPRNELPVFAPVGGRITEIHVSPGTVVAAGAPLVTFVRDPIPPPTLTLTGALLEPAKESIHESIVEFRRTREERRILETELTRLRSFAEAQGETELPLVPRQRIIDLRYQILRVKGANERAHHELEKHGFSEDQIAAMAEGHAIPSFGQGNWKQALVRNGLWPEDAEKVLATLDADSRKIPWVIAAIGELAASGRIDAALLAWLDETPDASHHFIDVASMRQRGHSVARIRQLHDLGALEPIVILRAPKDGAIPDWDVSALDVKPGARVEAGERLVTLLDPRTLWLCARPVGEETPFVLDAVARGTACRARPLVAGSGPELSGVVFTFATSDPETGGTIARAEVTNEPLQTRPESETGAFRSWRLRRDLRYRVKVPVQRIDTAYVLPRAAVTRDGADRVAFIQDGDGFKPVPVVVAYENEESVVVAIDREARLHVGDPVVMSGAYALGMALQEGDAGAGHHHHDH